jgi:uncharacterized protein (UPF0276 family)
VARDDRIREGGLPAVGGVGWLEPVGTGLPGTAGTELPVASGIGLPVAAGIGLKPEHVRQVVDGPASVGFVEVHAENYMVDGGPLLVQLERVRERCALSIHGVGLSIGGEGRLDKRHLRRLAALLERFEPHSFSEHLAWSTHGGRFYNDLLPLPWNGAALRRVCDHVDEVQGRLKRRVLIENPSTYVEFESSTMDEAQFIAELVRRTGCGLLLDVSNAYVSAVNHGRDALAFIAALPLAAVGEIHLAGFGEGRDSAGDRLLIDTHACDVDAAVWGLYEATLRMTGPKPTLIERDAEIPPLEWLWAEMQLAQACLERCAAEQGSRR